MTYNTGSDMMISAPIEKTHHVSGYSIHTALLILLAFLLSACAPTPPTAQPRPQDNINQLLRAADQSPPIRAAELRMEAARQLLRQGRQNEAMAVLDRVETRNLPPSLGFEIARLRAEDALRQDDSRTALAQLDHAQLPRDMNQDELRQLSELRADALGQQQQHLDAARELISSVQMTDDPELRSALHQRIWYSLSLASRAELEQAARSAHNTYFEQGWFELALRATETGTETERSAAIQAWQLDWDTHPAADLLPVQLQPTHALQPIQLAATGQRIALALPQQGQLMELADRVREGLVTAMHTESGQQSQLISIDSYSLSSAEQLFEMAQQQGAELIIGPMERDLVNQIAQFEAAHPLPVLALNLSTEGANPPWQLDLATDQQAQLLAQRALQRDQRHALIISAPGAWAQRLSETLTLAYTRQGGQILGQMSAGSSSELPAQVRSLLLQDSEIARTMPRQSQSGQNVQLSHQTDVIFLIADTRLARQIKPLLNYYYAGRIPVLATSHIYNPDLLNPREDDLNGITFMVMPWYLGSDSTARQQITERRLDALSDYGQFYAQGADAWRLHAALDALSRSPDRFLEGDTGRLSASPQRRILRELNWATFRNGVAELITD